MCTDLDQACIGYGTDNYVQRTDDGPLNRQSCTIIPCPHCACPQGYRKEAVWRRVTDFDYRTRTWYTQLVRIGTEVDYSNITITKQSRDLTPNFNSPNSNCMAKGRKHKFILYFTMHVLLNLCSQHYLPNVNSSYLLEPKPTIDEDPDNDNKKCGSSDRVFDLRGDKANHFNCEKTCFENEDCVAYSVLFDNWCIGCRTDLTDNHSGTYAYKKTGTLLP